jgi:tetratricopeptide (TPR) repeat protein
MLVVLAVFGAWGTAEAQPADDEAARLTEARRHMEEGQSLYVRGRYVESAQEFLQAYDLQRYSAFLYNAAVAYERFGNVVAAATNFERYLSEEPGAADRADVEARIARLRGGAPGPTPAAPRPAPAEPEDIRSLLTVQTNPSGCRIVVHGNAGAVVAEGTSPFASPLEAGAYTITATGASFRPATTDPLSVEPGKVYVVRVEMAQGAFLGWLRVVSNVPGAQVFVDDHDVGAAGTTPFAHEYPIGAHRVWVEKPGFRPLETSVDLAFGEDVSVRADLVREDRGFLDLRANLRGAAVFVDERRIGSAPIDARLHAGRHVVRVEADGYKTFEGRAAIERGKRTRVDVRMRPRPSRTPAWVSTGVSLAIFGVAGYLGLTASDLYDELDTERQQGTLVTNDPRIQEGFFYSLFADIGFLLGTVVGGFAIYYFLRDPLPDSSAEARAPVDLSLRPLVGPEVAGLSLGGAL